MEGSCLVSPRNHWQKTYTVLEKDTVLKINTAQEEYKIVVEEEDAFMIRP